METYLITGGAGFIGSHIAQELSRREDARLLVLDDLSSGKLANLEGFKGRVEFHKKDIRDYEGILGLFAGVDYVFHEAALVSVAASVERPEENHSVNVTGTFNVLRAARAQGVRRVVLASSAAVYGDEPSLPKREDMTPRPESPYGLAKVAAEHYARLYSRLYGMPVIALRYFNVYGPRQDASSPYSGVVSIFVEKALARAVPTVFGDGRQSRDFVFVSDVVRANLLAMHERSLRGGEIFNVATGRPTDLEALLRAVGELEGERISPRYAPARAGDIQRSLADISKAREVLGYEPKVSLEGGLRELLGRLKAARSRV